MEILAENLARYIIPSAHRLCRAKRGLRWYLSVSSCQICSVCCPVARPWTPSHEPLAAPTRTIDTSTSSLRVETQIAHSTLCGPCLDHLVMSQADHLFSRRHDGAKCSDATTNLRKQITALQPQTSTGLRLNGAVDRLRHPNLCTAQWPLRDLFPREWTRNGPLTSIKALLCGAQDLSTGQYLQYISPGRRKFCGHAR